MRTFSKMTPDSSLDQRQPYLFELPARVPKQTKNKWDEAREMQLIQQTEGLIGITDAADLLGLSRQRVHQIINSGRLGKYEFLGKLFLSLKAVREFQDLDRPHGAPRKLLQAA